MRAGYENTQLFQNDRYSMGHGFLAGLTFTVWRVEIDFNYTLRKKPTALVPGYLLYDSKVLLGMVFKPGLAKR